MRDKVSPLIACSADLVLHVCVSSSFRTLASILRCTLVSVTFYRYDFNKFDIICTDFSELFCRLISLR